MMAGYDYGDDIETLLVDCLPDAFHLRHDNWRDRARSVEKELSRRGYRIVRDEPSFHVVEFQEDGWLLKHPLSCRTIDLFDCALNHASAQFTEFSNWRGRYRVELVDGEVMIHEKVT